MIEKFKEFFDEKRELASGIVIGSIILVTLVILVLIWSGIFYKKEIASDINKFNLQDSYIENREEYYKAVMRSLLNANNFESLYKKIDLKYLDENGLNENNAKDYFVSNYLVGTNPVVLGCSSSTESEDIYVFRIEYRINGLTKYANIIENDLNSYSVNFSQELDDNFESNYSGKINGIVYDIKMVSQTTNNMKYQVKLTNTNSDDLTINFNDLSSFQLKVGDDYYKLSSVVVDNNSYVLTKDSTINRELFFDISSELQSSISGLRIANAQIGEQKLNIDIDF